MPYAPGGSNRRRRRGNGIIVKFGKQLHLHDFKMKTE
jgi:hypothetical protein